jgi:hypothetical protein
VATWPTSEHVVHLAAAPALLRPNGTVQSAFLACRIIYYAKADLEFTDRLQEVTCLNCLKKMR